MLHLRYERFQCQYCPYKVNLTINSKSLKLNLGCPIRSFTSAHEKQASRSWSPWTAIESQKTTPNFDWRFWKWYIFSKISWSWIQVFDLKTNFQVLTRMRASLDFPQIFETLFASNFYHDFLARPVSTNFLASTNRPLLKKRMTTNSCQICNQSWMTTNRPMMTLLLLLRLVFVNAPNFVLAPKGPIPRN